MKVCVFIYFWWPKFIGMVRMFLRLRKTRIGYALVVVEYVIAVFAG